MSAEYSTLQAPQAQDPFRRYYRAVYGDPAADAQARHERDVLATADELRAWVADLDLDELEDTARNGHPAELRAAALDALRKLEWKCTDCGALRHDEPSDYDDPDYEDGPLCRACARERFENTHVFVRARVGEQSFTEQSFYIARPFVEVPF